MLIGPYWDHSSLTHKIRVVSDFPFLLIMELYVTLFTDEVRRESFLFVNKTSVAIM